MVSLSSSTFSCFEGQQCIPMACSFGISTIPIVTPPRTLPLEYASVSSQVMDRRVQISGFRIFPIAPTKAKALTAVHACVVSERALLPDLPDHRLACVLGLSQGSAYFSSRLQRRPRDQGHSPECITIRGLGVRRLLQQLGEVGQVSLRAGHLSKVLDIPRPNWPGFHGSRPAQQPAMSKC
jgi:hypothetical protein